MILSSPIFHVLRRSRKPHPCFTDERLKPHRGSVAKTRGQGGTPSRLLFYFSKFRLVWCPLCASASSNPSLPWVFKVGFGHKWTSRAGRVRGRGGNGGCKAASQPFKARPCGCWGSRASRGWDHTFLGVADHDVLSAAFPEELPVDLKHRKLGEHGRVGLGRP